MHLIVGATGSLGGQVAKALLAAGERVRALVPVGQQITTVPEPASIDDFLRSALS